MYSTYVGGSLGDEPSGIGVDLANDTIIAGTTSSNDFPVTAGAFQTTDRPYTASQTTITGFVTKLNPPEPGLYIAPTWVAAVIRNTLPNSFMAWRLTGRGTQ